MKLSRTVVYAIQALIELAQCEPKLPMACSELAGRGKLPGRFLLQILRTLVSYGILTSTRGVAGGYQLARPADEVTLFDIMEAFENSLRPALPQLPGIHPRTREELLKSLEQIYAAERRALKGVTLANLVPLPSEARAQR